VTALELIRLRNNDEMLPEQQIIQRQVDHLVRLVDDLLDISRITSGKIDLKVEPVNISKVISEAIEMVSPLLEERSHRLSLDIEPNLYLEGDSVRLTQVVNNLLTNAARYTDVGGHIRLSAAHEETGSLRISIKDNGIGIPEPLLTQVFDLFFQTKQGVDRREGGLGIGLALVKSIVELHGGSVQANSRGEGQGSEFIVRLPSKGMSESPHQHSLTHSIQTKLAVGELRIMIVDDNVDAADTLGRLLAINGHVVKVFNDPVTALTAVEHFKPEIAVLDIGLPVLDGYELAKRMRTILEGHPCRLIALTGYGQDADKAKSQVAGIERHFVKPVDLNELICFVNELPKA
jgi:CheY-like chemotaxis protein